MLEFTPEGYLDIEHYYDEVFPAELLPDETMNEWYPDAHTGEYQSECVIPF